MEKPIPHHEIERIFAQLDECRLALVDHEESGGQDADASVKLAAGRAGLRATLEDVAAQAGPITQLLLRAAAMAAHEWKPRQILPVP